MKLKVCGMNHNITEVAELQPDYLGFIFYDKSSRYFDQEMPELKDSIEKIGVFVNTTIEIITQTVAKYQLNGVQLHGSESAAFCNDLKTRLSKDIKIIKAFAVDENFDFSQLKTYEGTCDYYLFDTKGKLPGGNGYTFNWNILNSYPSKTPFFLSGGIGLEELEKVKSFLETPVAKYCHAIDVNSRFETEPGLKKINELEQFINELQH
ncbi:MAG: phosphoribosylanthranilate isomerase [Bacteroidota bacterium]